MTTVVYTKRGRLPGVGWPSVQEPKISGKYLVIPAETAGLLELKPDGPKIAVAIDGRTNELVVAKRLIGVFLTKEEVWEAAQEEGEIDEDKVLAIENHLMYTPTFYYTGTARIYCNRIFTDKKVAQLVESLDGKPLKFKLYRFDKETGKFGMLRIQLKRQDGGWDDRQYDTSEYPSTAEIEGLEEEADADL